MKIFLDGYRYCIKDLTEEEIEHLDTMIEGASLEQRRFFYDLRQQIKRLKEWQLL